MDKNEILSSNRDVRYYVAGNPNMPVDVLAELAKDSDCDVRSNAASNPNMPVDVLAELAKDSYWAVRSNAARTPKLKEVLTDKK